MFNPRMALHEPSYILNTNLLNLRKQIFLDTFLLEPQRPVKLYTNKFLEFPIQSDYASDV